MSDQGQIDRIENFLKGKLSAEDATAFEKEMLADSALSKNVEMESLLHDLVIENRLLDVKNLMKAEEVRVKKIRNWKKALIISAAALITGSVVLLIANGETKEASDSKPSTGATSTQTNSVPDEKQTSNGVVINSEGTVTTTDHTVTSTFERNGEVSVVNEVTATTDPVQNISEEKKMLTEEKVESTTQPNTTQDLCEKALASARLVVHAACEGQQNGEILVSGINSSISVLIEGGNNQHALAKGKYDVKLVTEGCNKLFSDVSVTEKFCEKDYSFNPFIGEVWDIPSSEHTGKLQVYDKSGGIHFEKEISGWSKESWAGENVTGELNTGYYIFVIKYTDGSVRKGTVTIVR